MKKNTQLLKLTSIIVAAFIALIGLSGCSAISSHNSLANKQEDVMQAKSKIDVALQERYDLVPNVVSTVQAYMTHESTIFKEIADARSKIGSASTQDIKNEGQTQLDSALSRLLVLTENYPELKADVQTSHLISQLEMLETRLVIARSDYNTVATAYNKSIRNFPTSIWAEIYGFHRVELYQSDNKASTAPSVSFNTNK